MRNIFLASLLLSVSVLPSLAQSNGWNAQNSNAVLAPAPPAPPSATIPPVESQSPGPTGVYVGVPGGTAAGVQPFVYVPLTGQQQQSAITTHSKMLPAGTKLQLSLDITIHLRTARKGDDVYMRLLFPITENSHVMLPSGTYVQGKIDQIKIDQISRTDGYNNRTEIKFHLTKLIIRNKYVVEVHAPEYRPKDRSIEMSDSMNQRPTYSACLFASGDRLKITHGTHVSMTLKYPLRISQ